MSQDQQLNILRPGTMSQSGNEAQRLPEQGPSHAREILIKPLNHGYHVTVNCQTFAVESKEALLHRLGLYLSDPASIEAEWMSGKLKF